MSPVGNTEEIDEMLYTGHDELTMLCPFPVCPSCSHHCLSLHISNQLMGP